VSGVPAGATALFGAGSLTAGQSTQLAVSTTGGTAPGSYPLTIRATGLLNGAVTVRAATVSLQVQAPGVTSLAGQVLDEEAEPVRGALVKLGTLQTTTDAAGNFPLPNPPAGPDQLLFIDGGPASTPGRSYPVIPYTKRGRLHRPPTRLRSRGRPSLLHARQQALGPPRGPYRAGRAAAPLGLSLGPVRSLALRTGR
jgi:hypothetical protein